MPPAAKTPKPRSTSKVRTRSSARAKQANDSSGTALTTAPGVRVDELSRHEMIAVAAYFRALKRGFAPGDPLKDWVEAEAEIMSRYPCT